MFTTRGNIADQLQGPTCLVYTNSERNKSVFKTLLKELTASVAPIAAGRWFLALGPAVNDRAPKCVTVGLTTRSPRVADRSPCLLPTDATGRHRSARYVGASPWRALNVSCFDGSHFLPFMKTGVTSRSFTYLGYQLCACIANRNLSNGYFKISDISLSIRGCSWSGPGVLSTFRLFSFFSVLSSSKLMSISKPVNGGSLKFGCTSVFSVVNTLKKVKRKVRLCYSAL